MKATAYSTIRVEGTVGGTLGINFKVINEATAITREVAKAKNNTKLISNNTELVY